MMIRLVISFFIFFQVANSASFTYPDFSQCYKINTKSFVYFGDTRAIAVTKHLAVAYSQKKPTVNFVKFDPFLNLYLFSSKKTLKPVRLKSTHLLKLGEWIAGMDDTSLYAGNFAKSGDLLDSFYLQNAQLEENSIISCLCCEVYGLGIGAGSFIGSEYIKRFINSKEIYYGDIGVRFEKQAKSFVVKNIDPFFKNQMFQSGDKILKINGKKVSSLKQLNQTVLFAKPKSTIKIEFLRQNKIYKNSITVASRMGGGYLSDSFLERKGVFFDKDMKINKINEKSFGMINGLKIGDKLIQIDHHKIKSSNDLKMYLSKTKQKTVQLLFDRKDFQFFVKLGL
ncbi:DUF7488 domain-containing protein [Sulfurospirillum arcachonense]|uniref:DUF7488 domain-containing protein n=1 Tax=Sulfurospirillum arcachonense TaxID=57666 RepID=UPI00046AB7CD|nr:PDZ domain-containing protein [Sulfurospirillum arcachonense]